MAMRRPTNTSAGRRSTPRCSRRSSNASGRSTESPEAGTSIPSWHACSTRSRPPRREPVARPFAFTSLRSAAYARESRRRGARPRKRSGSRSTNGVTSFSQAPGSVTVAGGTSRQPPGSVDSVSRNGPKRPSPARAASNAIAAASPVAIPAGPRRPVLDWVERRLVGGLDHGHAGRGDPEGAVDEHATSGGRDGGVL